MLLPLFLGIMLELSLILVGVALTPPWALPRSVVAVLADRRETLLYTGIAIALALGLAAVIAVGAS